MASAYSVVSHLAMTCSSGCPRRVPGGEGRREVLVAVDRADVFVADRLIRLQAVIRQSFEDDRQHRLETHPGEIGADAAVNAEPEAGVAVREAVEDDFIRLLERLRVVVGESVRHPDPISGPERMVPDLAVFCDRPAAALGRGGESHELLGGRIEERRSRRGVLGVGQGGCRAMSRRGRSATWSCRTPRQ